MKLLTTAPALEKEFRRLINEYEHFNWATAWASSSSEVFKDLINNQDKIYKIVVGIHFYQTHPDFIKNFIGNKKVRFIQQPEGTFHPKLYLFSNNNHQWEMIIGSANFTKEAFSRNTEASLLISNTDNDSSSVKNEALKLIEKSFSEGAVFNQKELEKYTSIWRTHQQKIKSLSGKYGSETGSSKPLHKVKIANKSWREFMNLVESETAHALIDRLRVLEIAKGLFSSEKHFSDLSTDQRKFIAGIPNKLDESGAEFWGYFGSMKGSGYFKNKIINNDKNISKALDQIPLNGQITKNHFDMYINHFSKSFTGNYIGTATRLLCMKRPDVFVCLDSKNKSRLCEDFGIVQSKMDYNRYWNDIIERIYDSRWWNNPEPKNQIEVRVSESRAAFLDSCYYDR